MQNQPIQKFMNNFNIEIKIASAKNESEQDHKRIKILSCP